MSDKTLLTYAIRDVLREILGYQSGREIGCTVDYVLVDPHAFLNFVLMSEQDSSALPKFRERLTEILQNKNGS
jgi:hypothetical protein